jgi:hypothetical protein
LIFSQHRRGRSDKGSPVAWRETQLPGSELRNYFGSEAADQAGWDNVIGIKNPAVDAMIERVVRSTASCFGTITLCRNGASTSCGQRQNGLLAQQPI